MKTTEHTPGPWEYVPTHNHDSPHDIEIQGDRRKHKGGADSVCWLATVKGNATSGDIPEANARLIAAAPDLLAACEELCHRLEVNELVNRPHAPGNEYDQPAYDRAKAAIAKAKDGGK